MAEFNESLPGLDKKSEDNFTIPTIFNEFYQHLNDLSKFVQSWDKSYQL